MNPKVINRGALNPGKLPAAAFRILLKGEIYFEVIHIRSVLLHFQKRIPQGTKALPVRRIFRFVHLWKSGDSLFPGGDFIFQRHQEKGKTGKQSVVSVPERTDEPAGETAE